MRIHVTIALAAMFCAFIDLCRGAEYNVNIGDNDQELVVVLPRPGDPPVPGPDEDVVVHLHPNNEDGRLTLNCEQFRSVVKVNLSLKNEDGWVYIRLPYVAKPMVVTLTDSHDNEDGEVHVISSMPATQQTIELVNNNGDEGVFRKYQPQSRKLAKKFPRRTEKLIRFGHEVWRAKRHYHEKKSTALDKDDTDKKSESTKQGA
jgi:hypothetical protein